jgi:2'-5' RNA ligase
MRRMSRRLFLALPVPDATRRSLGDWTAGFRRRDDGWRWVAPDGIHLTLRFYGATDEDRLTALLARLRALAAAHAPVDCVARGWGVFPSPARPRVLWAGVRGGLAVLAALAAAAEREARELGYEPEGRPFHPHITLARAAQGARARRPGPPDDSAPDFGALPVREIVLYESRLGPGGATYERVVTLPIGGPRDA